MARAAPLAAAYLATAAVGLLCLLWARRVLPAPALRTLLGFFFIAALSAGLEPATARARALARRAPPRLRPVLAVSAIKALAATPALTLLWRIADPNPPLIVQLIGVAGAVVGGFWASELRVRLDLDGRHAAALWLKQGSLSLALLGAVAGAAAGWPTAAWLMLATAPRLLAAIMLAERLAKPGDAPVTVGEMARDRGWAAMSLISIMAAIGGSADRLVGLGTVPPAALAGYVLLYELLSRFWALPYLAAPVLFARLAGGLESEPLRAALRRATLRLGALMIAGVALASALAGGWARVALGLPLGWPATAFAAAIVAAALTQLILAELQGLGATGRALMVAGVGAVLAPPLFLGFARAWGVEGLLLAWPVKSAAELALALGLARRGERGVARGAALS